MIVSLIFILMLLALFVYITSKEDSKYMKNVPGPKPLLFFGNTLDFAMKPTYKWMDVFARYVEIYGRILRIHDGRLSGLLVTDPKFLEYILTSTKIIDKAPQYDYLHGWLGNGLAASTGNKWKTYRRLLTPAFHFSIIENFIEVFNSAGLVFIGKLKSEVNKESVDISEYIGLYTLDIIAEAAMGVKLDTQTNNTSAFVQNTKLMGKIVFNRVISVLHPALYPFTPDYFKEKRAVQVLHKHTDSIIQKRVAERSGSSELSQNGEECCKKKRLAFLDLLLSYTIDGHPLPSLDVREEVDTFMFAGHDTSSTAIAFAMYSLANNPDIQEKAFQEQKEIFKDLKNVNITNNELKKMKYLELVIKETLRLYPPVPIIGRKFTEDEEWNGTLFKKGTPVMMSPYLMHRNPHYFPDPLKFIPERFENSNLISPFTYIPFSLGPRNCIGQKFGVLEIKCTLSNVLRNFQLLPAIPEHVPQISPDTVLSSRNGVCISLLARN